jgi:biotin operon repressor
MLIMRNRSPALQRRARQSAIVARLTLTIFRNMTGDFGHDDLVACVPDLLISMVIRENDEAGNPPLSLSEISRLTGISRRTVGRRVDALVERGAFIHQVGVGVYGNDGYLEDRIEAEFFMIILKAIAEAADALSKLNGEEK